MREKKKRNNTRGKHWAVEGDERNCVDGGGLAMTDKQGPPGRGGLRKKCRNSKGKGPGIFDRDPHEGGLKKRWGGEANSETSPGKSWKDAIRGSHGLSKTGDLSKNKPNEKEGEVL